ncbi:hypothetical protein QA640_24185 [Bradyrhizobium sp. CB82]|uniref:hypothetical protein n=1 Tax=Bradyrhizobium sp. CB82 TaxID=3039159 RepID=UPI0024B0E844|nr:hypothetical protein [Bradyrhizobium sp. CB82]WFU37576.1 hypothetical protein QA640_24185 [Bradyrhizobium sp. CB82]
MRFRPEQHFRMADRLSAQALDQADLKKRDRIEATARVFRRLAVRAYLAIDASMKRRDWSRFKDDATFAGLIDTPSPWSSLAEWECHLEDLEKLPPSKQLRLLIEQAEEAIVRRKLGLL